MLDSFIFDFYLLLD